MSHRQDQAPVVSQGLDKATCQFYHAQRRSHERFGVPLSPQMAEAMSKEIVSGAAVCLHEQHEDATLWVVRWPKQAGPVYAGTDVRVGFDRTTGQITTLLPMTFSAAKAVASARGGGRRGDRRGGE